MTRRIARSGPILARLLWTALLVPCQLRAQCAGCSKSSFDGPRFYELPGSQVDWPPIAVGDFNGDGYLDVVSYDGIGSFLVFPGSSTGTFGTPTPRVTGFTPRTIVAGDFNGDGSLDVIAASSGPNLTLFPGDGKGSLEAPITISTPSSAQSLATGDFNGDGILDLAYLDKQDNLVLLFGAPGGMLGNPQTLPVGPYPVSLTVADLNGDGRGDIVVANYSGNTISIVLGRSSGPYPPAVNYPGGESPVGVAVGDFNSDGKADLAILDYNYYSNTGGSLQELFGLGDGSFVVGPSFSVLGAFAIVATDFTGDGIVDLLVGGGTTLSLYKGNGSGGFTLDATSAGTVEYPILLVGDLNRDGVPDVVTGDYELQGFTVFLSQAGRLNLSRSIAENSGFGTLSAVVDFDGAGRPGLVVGSCCSQLSIYSSDGAGNLSPAGNVPFSGNVSFLASADLNGDGKGDVIVGDNSSSVYVMLGSGAGLFSPLARYPVQDWPRSIAIADLNHDGIPDLIVGNVNSNSVSVLLGAGGGTFRPATSFSVDTYPDSLAVGDFDGDTFPDVVTANYGGSSISVLLGDGLGGFRSNQVIPVGFYPQSVVSGDFDGDGRTDLALLLLKKLHPNMSLVVLKGDGAGNFSPASDVTVNDFPSSLLAADLNGDGRLDLVLGGINGGLAVRMNDGTGGFPTSTGYSVGPYAVLGVGDFDGDGTLDLVSSTYYGVNVLLNTRCKARHLAMMQDVPACDGVDIPFATQPKVGVFDDGDNVVACASGGVSASLAPGTGTAGAALGGMTAAALSSGTAAFVDLSVNTAGSGYEILFQHAIAGKALSRAFRVGEPSPLTISGPSSFCSSDTVLFHADPAVDGYVWSLDGSTLGTGRDLALNVILAGPHTLEVQGNAGGCLATGSIPISVSLSPDAPVASNNSPILIAQTLQLFASTIPGATYSWTGPNGFTSTLQNPTIANATALATGLYTVRVVVGGCSSAPATTSVTVANPVAFYTVTPCRVIDTRNPAGPVGGPALAAHSDRSFILAGQCSIPPAATAVSVNVTVTQPTAAGDLRLVPAGNPLPLVSTINYWAAQTRANNAVIGLGAAGDLAVQCDQPSGTVGFILDVNGYFQ